VGAQRHGLVAGGPLAQKVELDDAAQTLDNDLAMAGFIEAYPGGGG
jgi:hypothetical protein